MNVSYCVMPRADRFLRRFALVLAALCNVVVAHASAANLIQIENAKPGTARWRLDAPAVSEIEGYASATSVERGGSIELFVNTREPSYTIEIFRFGWYGGTGGRLIVPAVTRTGRVQPDPFRDPATGLIECDWTDPYVVQTAAVPSDEWVSGIYLAKLTAGRSGRQRYVIFVVRDDARASDFLFQSSVSTFQAYNYWGGVSLYSPSARVGRKVSFNRPYIEGYGTGQFLSGPYTRQAEARGWEANMVRFLEREGLDVTYATSLDTHAHGERLLLHAAFLSVGHDEYWSWEMRDRVEAARDAGVSLAFFSGNSAYWQIRFEPSHATGAPDRTEVCYKQAAFAEDPFALDDDPSNDRRMTVRWRDAPVNRPEEDLIGVMYTTYNVDADLVVTNTRHWVYEGTALADGDVLPGLVGVETDRTLERPRSNIVKLAISPFQESIRGPDVSEMTMYLAPSGAIVFATGTIQWSWGLDDFDAPSLAGGRSRVSAAAQQMTRNVLAGMSKLRTAPVQ